MNYELWSVICVDLFLRCHLRPAKSQAGERCVPQVMCPPWPATAATFAASGAMGHGPWAVTAAIATVAASGTMASHSSHSRGVRHHGTMANGQPQQPQPQSYSCGVGHGHSHDRQDLPCPWPWLTATVAMESCPWLWPWSHAHGFGRDCLRLRLWPLRVCQTQAQGNLYTCALGHAPFRWM